MPAAEEMGRWEVKLMIATLAASRQSSFIATAVQLQQSAEASSSEQSLTLSWQGLRTQILQ
jgi:hypothetical protein